MSYFQTFSSLNPFGSSGGTATQESDSGDSGDSGDSKHCPEGYRVPFTDTCFKPSGFDSSEFTDDFQKSVKDQVTGVADVAGAGTSSFVSSLTGSVTGTIFLLFGTTVALFFVFGDLEQLTGLIE